MFIFGFIVKRTKINFMSSAITNTGRIAREELFKIYLAIDRGIIQEAVARNQSMYGLGSVELVELDSTLDDIIKADLSFDDIMAIASEGEEALNGFLKKAWNKVKRTAKKAGKGVKKVARKVAKTTTKIVKKAAKAVHRVVATPSRGVVTAALKLFKGKTASAFLYVFIPDNSPILRTNSTVRRKASRAKNFLKLLKKGAAFKDGYLEKHIRNNIVSHYKKTPEQLIKELSAGKDVLNGMQLGDGGASMIAATIAALAPVIAAVPSIINAFKPKQDVPQNSDFPKPIPAKTNVTNEPTAPNYKPANNSGRTSNSGGGITYTGDGSGPTDQPFYKTPAGIAAIVGGTVIIGGAVMFLGK
jgi:ElaB/YqjD/DUF883 family membrane-anchored ribosome-binding protein